MLSHLEGDVGDMHEAVALIEALCAEVLGIDAEQHRIVNLMIERVDLVAHVAVGGAPPDQLWSEPVW